MFCDEWTTAPENERLQQLFAPETRYEDVDKYNELLHWFHYQCYLFTDSHQELTDTVKEYWEQTKRERRAVHHDRLRGSGTYFQKRIFGLHGSQMAFADLSGRPSGSQLVR